MLLSVVDRQTGFWMVQDQGKVKKQGKEKRKNEGRNRVILLFPIYKEKNGLRIKIIYGHCSIKTKTRIILVVRCILL